MTQPAPDRGNHERTNRDGENAGGRHRGPGEGALRRGERAELARLRQQNAQLRQQNAELIAERDALQRSLARWVEDPVW